MRALPPDMEPNMKTTLLTLNAVWMVLVIFMGSDKASYTPWLVMAFMPSAVYLTTRLLAIVHLKTEGM
jgi:hypothetical protein